MSKEIDPIVKIAIDQANDFAASRSVKDLSVEEFKQLIEILIKFYGKE